MTRQTLRQGEYEQYTDKYFPRSKEILEAEGINPIVRYQTFARKGGEVKGVDEAVDFVKTNVPKARVYALRDSQQYQPCEPLMKIEGKVQDLVTPETVYLGIISGALTDDIDLDEVRSKAREIVQAAQGKPVIYFGARHFDYSLDESIARICKEAGFVGASTNIGAKAWKAKGIGTIPHALIVSYAAWLDEQGLKANPTIEAAKAFDRHIDKAVPRIVLIDTFNREITDTLETAEAIPNLAGVRIDTCGENYAQGAKEVELPKLDVPEKYLQGKGVSIAAVWALRKAIVEAGKGNLELVVSSGFNAEKTAAFVEADKVFQEQYNFPLFTSIGTGSIANPTMATSDIVAYFNKQEGWKELHKTGRPEIKSTRLEERK